MVGDSKLQTLGALNVLPIIRNVLGKVARLTAATNLLRLSGKVSIHLMNEGFVFWHKTPPNYQ